MSEWKFVGNYSNVMEAEMARTLLESYEITAFVADAHVGSILPHLTQSLGGIRLRVPANEEARALEVLSSENSVVLDEGLHATDEVATPLSDEDAAKNERVVTLVKRATYGALAGTFLVPVVGNIFSMMLYRQAIQTDRTSFARYKIWFMIGMVLNVFVFAVVSTFLLSFVLPKT